MPVYELTSAKTGQNYRVDFERDPSEADVDEAVAHFDNEAAQQAGVDAEVLDQGPLGTVAAKVRDVGPGFVGGVMETGGNLLNAAARGIGQLTGTQPGGLFRDVARAGEVLQQEGEILRPTNPFNPTANTIGSGIQQALGMVATIGASTPFVGTEAAMTTVPLALGGIQGGGQGVQTAQEMGIESPAGQLALAAPFAAAEVLAERLGGIGSKGLSDAVQRGVAGTLKAAGKTLGSEMIEEPVTGVAQDAATRIAGEFVEDPNRPGYTVTGYELPKLDRAFLERRKQEAIGGAAGGTVFAGLQLAAPSGSQSNQSAAPAPQAVEGRPLVRRFTARDGGTVDLEFEQEPSAQDLAEAQAWIEANTTPDDHLRPTQTPAAAGSALATSPLAAPPAQTAAPLTPLLGIAQRAGAVDPLLPEHVSDLTAEDIQDLETQNPPLSSSPSLSPTASVTKDSGPTAEQTAQVTAPGAGLSPAAGALFQTPITEPTSSTAPAVAAPTQTSLAAAAVPTNVSSAQDAVSAPLIQQRGDWLQSSIEGGVVGGRVQGNALRITAANLDEAKRGRGLGRQMYQSLVNHALSNGLQVTSDSTVDEGAVRVYESLQRAGYDVRRNPAAFEVNVEGRKALAAPDGQPVYTVTQSPTNQEQGTKNEEPSREGFTHTAIQRDLESGFMTTAGADALLDLAHTAFKAGQTFVQWSKTMLQRFGESIRQWLAGAWDHAKRSSQTGALNFTGKLGADLQKAGQALKQPPASPSVSSENGQPVNPKLVEAARGVARTEDPSSNLRLLFSTEQRLSNAEPSLEVRQHDAVTVPAALEMIARGGDPQLIAAMWRQHRNDVSQKKTTAPNPFTPSELMRDAYAVQARKSSTQMVPLQQVFDQMRKAEPSLTQAQFLNRVREDYQNGSVLLEGAEPLPNGVVRVRPESYVPFSAKQIQIIDSNFNPESSRAAGGTLQSAYMAAMQGRSSAMVPIADVYEQAKAQNPLLTPQQFMAEVQAGDNAGTVLLEPPERAETIAAAGPFVLRNASGIPSTNMMVQRGFTHLDVSGQRSQAGFVLNPLPALERLAKAVLPIHTQGQPFRVKDLGMRSILTGSPLPRELVKVLDMTENERQAVMQASAQVGRDLQTAVKAYIDRTGKPDLEVWDRVNDVMEGKPAALSLLNVIDPVLAERARRARNMLDDLSAAVAQTLPAGDLRTLIAGNMGSWMRRGYAAFDPESGWNFDNVMRAAALGRDIAGKSAAQIVANAKALLRQQNPQNGRTQKEWNDDIEADMRDLMDRNTWEASLVSGGSTVKKNVGSFMKRKTIPAEIRALMGEETNPLHRFSQSAAFQAQVIARHHGQLAMRSLGLQTGLFSTQRGGVYTQEIPADGSRWSGLAGVWTTPQLWEALGRTSTVNLAGTDLGGKLVDTLKALGNEAKLNRVALNPDSWLVNILGNWVSLLQSGDVFAFDFIRRMKEAHQLVNSGKAKPGAVWHAAHEAFTDVQRTMLARLRGMGVIGSSVTLNDIEASIPRHLLQWVAEDEARNKGLGAVKGAVIGQALGRGFGLPGRVIGGVAGSAGGALAGAKQLQDWQIKWTNYVMTGPDALARVTGFLTNYETALAAGMNTDQAAKWASDRTLNTFPNYSALPAPLRQLSRLGFTGSFIAFQWEVYRNFGWNVVHAVQELRSNNAAIQARGLRRLGGVSTIAALAGGGLAALIGLVSGGSGTDDERNKKWRKWFAAPWEKDAVLAFDKFDENGVSYYNTSYLLPQVTMTELIQAAADGKDPAESATRVVDRLSEQFVNGSVHLQPLLSAWMNQDRTGRKITNREGVEGAMIRADNAMKTILEPGFAAKIERIIYALREAEKNGRSYSVDEEMKRLVGVRQVTRTWEELVKRRYSKFTSDYMAERDEANKTLGENLPGAAIRAVERVNARVETLTKELQEYELDLRLMGIPESTIDRAKKDSNLQSLNPVRVRADGKRVEADTNR